MDKQNKEVDYEHDRIQCNLCGRWMKIRMYELHYDRCLDIQYLINIAKQKGEVFTREDLENCKSEVIDKLLAKYPPKKLEGIKDIWKKQ